MWSPADICSFAWIAHCCFSTLLFLCIFVENIEDDPYVYRLMLQYVALRWLLRSKYGSSNWLIWFAKLRTVESAVQQNSAFAQMPSSQVKICYTVSLGSRHKADIWPEHNSFFSQFFWEMLCPRRSVHLRSCWGFWFSSQKHCQLFWAFWFLVRQFSHIFTIILLDVALTEDVLVLTDFGGFGIQGLPFSSSFTFGSCCKRSP